jgi:protease I
MSQKLSGRKVAILATDGFEQVELTSPKEALESAGAQTHVIAPQGESIQGWNHHDKGDKISVDHTLDQVNPDDYDALMLPGGPLNPDQLRTNKEQLLKKCW